jgi:hypothetical protein
MPSGTSPMPSGVSPLPDGASPMNPEDLLNPPADPKATLLVVDDQQRCGGCL